jgi:hypothetical protein
VPLEKRHSSTPFNDPEQDSGARDRKGEGNTIVFSQVTTHHVLCTQAVNILLLAVCTPTRNR